MRRIEDVLDVWFDSGSMPFAQVHYPFENREWFDSHNPADFIVEYIGQTRGWFYTDARAVDRAVRPAGVQQRHQPRHRARQRRAEDVEVAAQLPGCLRGLRPRRRRCHALVPDVVVASSAAATWSSPRRASARACAQLLLPLWSTLLLLHAVRERRRQRRSTTATRPPGAPTRPTCSTATCSPRPRELLERGHRATSRPSTARWPPPALRDFADVLTNWYVRRSRDRFWAATTTGDAFDTLYTVLETLRRVAAPLLPLVTEEIWRGLTGGRSVHLTDWPDAAVFPADDASSQTMDRGARDRLGRPRPAQGARAAGAPAAGAAHRGQRRRRRARGVRRHPRATSSTSRPVEFVPLAESSLGRLRHRPRADRERARRSARGSARTCSRSSRRRRRATGAVDGEAVVGRRHRAASRASSTSSSTAGDEASAHRVPARRRFRACSTPTTTARARGGGPRARRRPRHPAGAQGRRPRGQRPHPPARLDAATPPPSAADRDQRSRPRSRARHSPTTLDHGDAGERSRAQRATRRSATGCGGARSKLEQRVSDEAVDGDGATTHVPGRRPMRSTPSCSRASARPTPQPRLEPTRRAVELLGDPQRSASRSSTSPARTARPRPAA